MRAVKCLENIKCHSDHGSRGASCQKLINQNSLDTMIDNIKPTLDMQELPTYIRLRCLIGYFHLVSFTTLQLFL